MRITLDTNRIMFPTQRRFNAAWREMSGDKVALLPQVAHEITHRRLDLDDLDNEIIRLEATLARMGNLGTRRSRLFVQSDLWWAEEFLRSQSPYDLIRLSREQNERVDAICDAIDPGAFPGISPQQVSTHSDTIIIAQALATGQSMLVTGNMRSIDHDQVNEWAARHAKTFGIESPEVLHVQDEAMPRLYAGPERRVQLCAIGLGAAWPDSPEAPLEEVDQALKRMCRSMVGAQLRRTGTVIANTWRDVADPAALLNFVRLHLPERMRQSERSHPAFLQAAGAKRDAES